MLSYDKSRIQDRKFILVARFHPDFARRILIPEIEINCMRYDVDAHLVNRFRKYQHTKNCLYFLLGFAYADIPAGQEYEVIMRINHGVIDPDSVMKCKATALCFFSEFRNLPIEFAWHGHHALCQIQFQDGIPDMIQGLYEIAERKPIKIMQEICLCSFDTLKANISMPSSISSTSI